MTKGTARTAGAVTMEDDTEVGAMTKTANMVDEAQQKHAEAVEAVEAARSALAEVRSQLNAAMTERSRLDALLDDGVPVEAEDVAVQVAANATTVDALTRLRGRRADALTKAETAAEDARKRVALAELRQLAADIDGFDVAAERARLVALVQDAYSGVLGTLYGFQDRLAEARKWAEDAQGVEGARVKVPPRFNTSVPVEVDGRSLVAPAQVSGVRDWFAQGLTDERAEARNRARSEANRARIAEAHEAHARLQQAQADAMPRFYGDVAEAALKGQRR